MSSKHAEYPDWLTQPDGHPVLDARRRSVLRAWLAHLTATPPPPLNPQPADLKRRGSGPGNAKT